VLAGVVGAIGCGGGGSSGGSSSAGAGSGPGAGGGSQTWQEPPGDRIVLADFEDGNIPAEFNFFVNNAYNTGTYTWSVDPTQGANGSSKSLKFHVTSGAPYFYFDPFHLAHTGYLANGKNVNRLGFWVKLPTGWGQNLDPYYNMHVGWYLSNDPSQNETNNGHFYHYIYLVPNSDWIHVVVGANYAWERDQGITSFDPGWSFHLLDFDSFFPRVTRFYITGAPNTNAGTPPLAFMPGEYDMWVDEIELFHEDDPLVASPAIVRPAVGTTANVTLTNAAGGPATYDLKVTDLDGSGVVVTDEHGSPISSVSIDAGATRTLTLQPNGHGTSNVVFFPHGVAQNPDVQNRSLNAGYRGSYDEPGAGVLVVAP
jgi:hypothetical protein